MRFPSISLWVAAASLVLAGRAPGLELPPEASLQVGVRERRALTPWRLFPDAGQFRADAALLVSLDRDPDVVALGPDLWYGIGDGLALGVVHSSYGTYGFYGLPSGLCLKNCERIYNNVGVRGLARFRDGDIGLAADTGLVVDPIEPARLSLRVGLAGQIRASWFRLELNPAIHVNLNQRDTGTKELFLLPFTAGFIVTPELRLDVQSGYIGTLDELGDAWILPVSAGGAYDWTEYLTVGVRFSYFDVKDPSVRFDPFDEWTAVEILVSLRF